RIVEPDVPPRGSVSASRTGTLAEAHFLPRQEADRVRLLSHGQKRLLQHLSGAKNLSAPRGPEADNGAERKRVSNLGIKFTRHLELLYCSCAARIQDSTPDRAFHRAVVRLPTVRRPVRRAY